MACYRVEIPDGVKLFGVTADGSSTTVLPGEYLVHQLPLKVPAAQNIFRFVGADAGGRDVHVPFVQFRRFLTAASRRPVVSEFADAA